MTTTEPTREELLTALQAVREAIDIPTPATDGDDEIRANILGHRLGHAVVLLRSVLAEHPAPNVPWSVEYLRERLAEHPVEGYKTFAERVAELESDRQWVPRD